MCMVFQSRDCGMTISVCVDCDTRIDMCHWSAVHWCKSNVKEIGKNHLQQSAQTPRTNYVTPHSFTPIRSYAAMTAQLNSSACILVINCFIICTYQKGITQVRQPLYFLACNILTRAKRSNWNKARSSEINFSFFPNIDTSKLIRSRRWLPLFSCIAAEQ